MILKKLSLGALLLFGLSAGAHAGLIFSFEFSDASGDKVTGRIFGLLDNTSGQTATSILIDSFTGQVGGEFGTATNDATTWASVTLNSFSVAAGQITFAAFGAQDAIASLGTFCINFVGCIDSTSRLQLQTIPILIRDFGGFGGVTFASVPEPSTGVLLVLGLLGLTIARRRSFS